MNYFDIITDNITKAGAYAAHQKNEFFKEVASYVGSVIDLTALNTYFEESSKLYKETVEESPNILVQQRSGILGFISTINKCALFALEQLKKTFDSEHIKDAIKGITVLEFIVSFVSLIELKKTYEEIKNYPKQWREAIKTNDIAKNILAGFGLLSKIAKAPITIIETITPLAEWINHVNLHEILQFDKWLPFLGAASLALSSAFTALKIWDLHDTYKIADKMKKKCCLELIRNMENNLKDEFKGNKPLLAKLNAVLAFDKGKQLKKIHKKELAFQTELSKEKPDPEVLLKLLDELNLPNKQNQAIIEQLKSTISLYEMNECLSFPSFKQTVLATTSELLDQTFREMNILIKKGENINLNTLKKELKRVAAELNPELLNQINRSSKIAYLNVIGDYNADKLKSVYQVEGEKIQGAVKKTVSVANNLLNKNEFRLADEKLSIAYKELKGRISIKTFSSKISLLLNTVGMASASITLAIAAGSLATPLAPIGIALGLLASALGLALGFYNTYKTVRFQETLGIEESDFQKKMQEQINSIDINDSFFFSLSPKQLSLFNSIKKQVAEGEFNKKIYSRFAVPTINWDSSNEERAAQKAVKQMNRIIKSINKWSEKKAAIQERSLVTHWSVELNKIDPDTLPSKRHENFRMNLLRAVENKEYYKLGKLKPIPLKSEWNRQQTAAVIQMNILIDSIHDASEKWFEKNIDTLTEKIAAINLQFKKEPELKTKRSKSLINSLKKQLKSEKKILLELQASRRKDM